MSSPTAINFADLMSELSRRGSRFFLWQGVAAVAAGLLLLFAPTSSAVVLSIFVGSWMIIDGIIAVGQSVDLKKAGAKWGWPLAEGIVAILSGIAIVLIPGVFAIVSSMFIIFFMAIGLVIRGVIQLSIPKPLRDGWSVTAGVLNVVIGVILGVLATLNPFANVWTLAWIAGAYTLMLGISAIIVSFQLRNRAKSTR